MFWRFEMRTASHIDSLLEKEDIPLGEILDEDDVLQECKAQNKKLIDFLSKKEVVEELVDLITKEPPTDIEDSIQYKHPNMACELLTADIGAITDRLADTETIFHKLWKFLDGKPPLNPLLASFFSKTVGSLLARRPELVIEHIKSQEDILSIFFKHLETSAIMDLILRLITCIDSQELRTRFLEWLNDQKFIQRLVDLIDPEQSEEVHSNAAQSLCDIIRLTREHMSQLQECAESDPLLAAIEMQETVSDLLEHMFCGKRAESALINGVTILLSLLEFKKQNDTFLFPSPEGQEQMTPLDAERLATGVSGTLKAIVPKLSDLNQLLRDPPRIESMLTTIGKLEPPFGFVRLQVCKLISSLLVTNSPAINSELARLGTIKTLWDLFFNYMWNNFLHLEVEKSLATILANSPTETEEEGKLQHPLLVHLFTECKLVQRIVDMWEDNDSSQQQGGKRYGYMGHLTRIANCLTNEMEKGCNSEQIKSLMEEYVPLEYRDKWTNFVIGGLADMNKRNVVDMVGTNAFHSSSDDEDSDFPENQFGKDTALQQFGFTEEEFTEQDQGVNNPFDRISDINFSISANEDNPNSALFEACCNEKIGSFPYNNSDDEDMWEEKEFTFSGDNKPRDRSVANKDENDSSDSDDALGEDDFPPVHRPKLLPPNEDIRMDVDENWVANFDETPMDSSVPMDSAPAGWQLPDQTRVSGDTGGWANFDDFNSGFQAPRSDDNVVPRSSSPVEMESSPSQQVSSSQMSTTSDVDPSKPTPPQAPPPPSEEPSTDSSNRPNDEDRLNPDRREAYQLPSSSVDSQSSNQDEEHDMNSSSRFNLENSSLDSQSVNNTGQVTNSNFPPSNDIRVQSPIKQTFTSDTNTTGSPLPETKTKSQPEEEKRASADSMNSTTFNQETITEGKEKEEPVESMDSSTEHETMKDENREESNKRIAAKHIDSSSKQETRKNEENKDSSPDQERSRKDAREKRESNQHMTTESMDSSSEQETRRKEENKESSEPMVLESMAVDQATSRKDKTEEEKTVSESVSTVGGGGSLDIDGSSSGTRETEIDGSQVQAGITMTRFEEEKVKLPTSLESPLIVKPNGPAAEKRRTEERGNQDDPVTTRPTQNGPV